MEGFQSSLAQLCRPPSGTLREGGCDPRLREGVSCSSKAYRQSSACEDSRRPCLDLSEGKISLRCDWARGGEGQDQLWAVVCQLGHVPTHCVTLGKPLPLSGLPFLICKISGGSKHMTARVLSGFSC